MRETGACVFTLTLLTEESPSESQAGVSLVGVGCGRKRIPSQVAAGLCARGAEWGRRMAPAPLWGASATLPLQPRGGFFVGGNLPQNVLFLCS